MMFERESRRAGRARVDAPAHVDGPFPVPSEARAPAPSGDLTDLPLDDGEIRLIRRLAEATRDDGAIAAATDRYRSLREAMGLGIGCDPDVVEGLDRLLEALSLIRSARQGRGRPSHAADASRPIPQTVRGGRLLSSVGAAPDPAPALEASLLNYGAARRRSLAALARD